ncbi:type I polyketide synthase [Salinactinospora qingdaonensis]|uniref:Acyl transferase domain-containing protein n=1 Tax=Salinactinospora qingdaonensis TaxID=702744 RepID=A0ABP7FSS9_9ACTN
MSTDLPPEARRALESAVSRQRALQERIRELEGAAREPIAVTGVGLRLPGGVTDLDSYWDLLLNHHVDPMGWLDRAADGRRVPQREQWRPAGVLDEVDGFDPEFFGISPFEADWIDPQQRLVLETAWEALEDANIPAGQLRGSPCGVYMGVYGSDYYLLQSQHPDGFSAYSASGVAHCMIANRLSYLLDLTGPSLAVDTGCSASLFAVDLAVQALRARTCDIALVGGVNTILTPHSSEICEQCLPLASDGRCRSYDADADGYARGEGAAVMVLQRHSSAREQGRRVHALIRGSATNHGGRASALTAPNPAAHTAVMRAALANADVAAADIGYIEGHGTGTTVGDPIEVTGITDAYGTDGLPCAIGSLKARVGHLEAAAGIAGLLKSVLVLKHRRIPAQAHFQRLNPEIDIDGTRFYIPDQLNDLAGDLAAVSSFGFGGANAHVVLEAAPAPAEPPAPAPPPVLPMVLPLSARSPQALADLSDAYAKRLAELDDTGAAHLAAALMHHRDHHPLRRMVTGDTADELRAALTEPWTPAPHPSPDPVGAVLVFSGQGSQWAGMGADLEDLPGCAAEIAACESIVAERYGWSLREELRRTTGAEPLADLQRAQFCLATVQLALARQLTDWGARPAAVVGHSMGEVTAATFAGALDRAEMFEILAHRGRIIHANTHGAGMASVTLDQDRMREILREHPRVDIATVNAPTSLVVAGPAAAVTELLADLERRGVRCKRIGVEHASHCRLITDSVERELVDALAGIQGRPATVPFHSTVTGRRYTEPLDAYYWGRNMREPVSFAQAITALPDRGNLVLVECSPHAILAGDLQRLAEVADPPFRHPPLATMRRGESARHHLATTLAGLYEAGVDVDFTAVQPPPSHHVELEHYPWQHRRHWFTDHETAPSHGSHPSPARRPATAGEVLEVLRRRLARAGGVDPTQIDPDLPVDQVALESLAVVELYNQVQRTFGFAISLTLQHLFSTDSLATLAGRAVAGDGTASEAEQQDSGPQPAPVTLLRLNKPSQPARHVALFPHAGALRNTYRPWAGLVDGDVQLWEATLRDAAIDPADPQAWPRLLTGFADHLAHLEGPLTLFGHSLGATVAYATARELRRRGRDVAHLVVCGGRAHPAPEELPLPDDPHELLDAVGRRYGAVPAEIRADDELARIFGSNLHADLTLHNTYRSFGGEPIDVALTALAGHDDPGITRGDLDQWAELTSGPFQARTVPGDHFPSDEGVHTILSLLDTPPA